MTTWLFFPKAHKLPHLYHMGGLLSSISGLRFMFLTCDGGTLSPPNTLPPNT